jgi:DNA-directed RNA polymerase specialized sigma24 family protein
MNALPEESRRLLEAKYYDRKSVRALAVEAGVGEKAMESRLARLRDKLKIEMLNRLRQ